MTVRLTIMKIVQQDGLNFLLTNRIPRRMLTRFMGWFSRIEQPLIRDISIRVWKFFADLDLSDAKQTNFRSMHDCFTRTLKDGARPVEMNPDIVVSPCDAIVGASGAVEDGQVLQIKGHAYALEDLLGDADHAGAFRNGRYVTLRLTSSMYHRFHAPHDCRVEAVAHFPGDTWNVNPVTLKRIERLFCKNERAVIRTRLCRTGHMMTLVPVAAILVAGIRLRFLDIALRSADGRRRTISCDAALRKGEEMGWFEHGSTIIVLVPEGFRLCDEVGRGVAIRVGQPLLRAPLPRDPLPRALA
jgi:phosphatidylserine decarboxylase